MKKLLAVQIIGLLLISGALGGLLSSSTIYDDVRSSIVTVLCLSCIKLDPKTVREFTFTTPNNADHPDFIIENLTRGPIFLAYREDVCEACDTMEPIIQEIFGVEYEKEETFFEPVLIDSANVTFIRINIDHTSMELRETLTFYDKENVSGLPMFTFVTLGYDRGFIKPYYVSVYGTLGLETYEERENLLTTLLQESIDLYKENLEGFQHP